MRPMSATIKNSLYPAFLQLRDRKVVVIGGGAVAERKVRALLASEARVHVVSPELSRTLAQWAEEARIVWHAESFRAGQLESAWLAIAATDDASTNKQVRDAAEQRRIWVNVVDDPALSAFHVPAIIDRSPITIAVSSGGHAPVLARRLRERFEGLIDDDIGALACALAERRQAIRRAYPDLTERRRFYEWALDGPAGALLREGRRHDAEDALDHALERPMEWPRHMLTLLRAPDTDPGLLTLNGLRALHEADALVYDADDHSEAVLAMARRDAERIPIPLTSALRADGTRRELVDTIRSHGRVVLLLSAGCEHELARGELDNLSQLAESMAIPTARL